ncbi:3'5'-cyclic nucleotide phosphodiesterase, partial [Opisthorchis viverrini]
GQDVPLRSVGPFITDSQLDTECVGSGISPTFYKNLATSTLGEYARIPTDTDNLHAAYTPESVRACYVRMRQVYEAVEQDRIGKATLLKNLHYAIMVMESTYISERRRIREEEEDLSEAATEFVPDEVRDWLASTFTRTQALSGIGNQKPRFRSVANAIRAGIFVERLPESGQDVPLRSVGPFITDSQLDTECVGSGISPTFYKNLATSTLGEYARIPTDTDNLHAAYTPESVRACYVRMRQVYEAVEQDRIGKATLLKNLHYAIMVMESTYISER